MRDAARWAAARATRAYYSDCLFKCWLRWRNCCSSADGANGEGEGCDASRMLRCSAHVCATLCVCAQVSRGPVVVPTSAKRCSDNVFVTWCACPNALQRGGIALCLSAMSVNAMQ